MNMNKWRREFWARRAAGEASEEAAINVLEAALAEQREGIAQELAAQGVEWDRVGNEPHHFHKAGTFYEAGRIAQKYGAEPAKQVSA